MNHAPSIETVPMLELRGAAAESSREAGVITVRDVDWSAAAGDFWVISGLHGSGKSDLLMAAGGLTAAAAGACFFQGHKLPLVEDEQLAERLRLGFVFEGGQLFSQLTVAENLALPLRYHHNLSAAEADARVRRMLSATELAPWAATTPGGLTRAWRKRAGLARALMLQPEVLLLDDPLAGLDARHRQWWLNFLGDLARGGELSGGRPLTLVATADDVRPWRNVARQFAVLQDQRLVVLGNWEQAEAAGNASARGWPTEPPSAA